MRSEVMLQNISAWQSIRIHTMYSYRKQTIGTHLIQIYLLVRVLPKRVWNKLWRRHQVLRSKPS